MAGQVTVSLDAQSLQAACSLSVAAADGKILRQQAIKNPRGNQVNTVKIIKESGEKPY
jgi:hypothetical protein